MSLTTKYRRTYALLKRAGHSPVKAFEVMLGAHRNEEHALIWLRIIFKARLAAKSS